ncbi:MAG: hypothetical protein P8181_18015, partial [bacterium]
GKLHRGDGRYSLAERPTFSDRWMWGVFFWKSKVRATLRWFKYMLTFDDWLDYIVRKAQRRTGVHLELTQAERRFPVVLLWPKLFAVLRVMGGRKPRKRVGEGEESDRNGGSM